MPDDSGAPEESGSLASGAGKTRGGAWLTLMGLGIGFLASLSGIGGGLFAGAILHFGRGFELKRATGTALVLVVATAIAATLTEMLKADPALDWGIIAALIAGALIGAQIGFIVSERIPDRPLRAIFAIVLLGSAVKMYLAESGAQADTPLGATDIATLAGAARGPADYAWSLLVGVTGGIVSPLLGIGGGLVVVPGLFLGLPDLGFATARACSLASASLVSARALTLKAKAGRVTWPPGIHLAIGALAGAALGVVALGMDPRVLEFGRSFLVFVLTFVGLRFLRELLRGLGR